MEQKLRNGITQLELEADDFQVSKLLKFIELLKKWNKVYNLTALDTDQEIMQLHLLDSLTVLNFIKQAKNILDVGSGAGLPGIPLAIMLPDVKFVLLDSNGKKTRFIQQAIIDLNLKNCTVENKRIEDYVPEKKFDTIITRAFAEIKDTIEKLKHFSIDNLRLLFMKSKNVENELKDLDSTYNAQIIKLNVPDLEAERSLIIITKVNLT